MARLCLRVKAKAKPKFSTRKYNRCPVCGRSGAFLRKFKMCRLCFRKYASFGQIPGVRKSSW